MKNGMHPMPEFCLSMRTRHEWNAPKLDYTSKPTWIRYAKKLDVGKAGALILRERHSGIQYQRRIHRHTKNLARISQTSCGQVDRKYGAFKIRNN